ncbi:MAG TPA: FtsX-like permease family protein [Bacteroidia bacterium]
MVAALGVTIGIAIFLFMNSLTTGFERFSQKEMFKNSAHIKIYKEDEMSEPLQENSKPDEMHIIVNPKITTGSKTLLDPQGLIHKIKKQKFVTNVIGQVNASLFYNSGKSQLTGTGSGVNIMEADAMFGIKEYMIAGNLEDLQGSLNSIIIGKGIAEKLNLSLGDNINVTSSYGVNKTLKIKGIFSTGSTQTDQSKSYINISTAQQFLKEGPSYITTIYVNTPDPDKAPEYAAKLQSLTVYRVEPWQVTNADFLSSATVRTVMMTAISFSILIVAAFGIYNILNMTVMQKINDIAILKAVGFTGKDVIRIFVTEAIVMGFIGTLMGLMIGAALVTVLKNVYMGPPVGYFPITYELKVFSLSFLLGLIVTICAGYFPARKASKVDPVSIFRK